MSGYGGARIGDVMKVKDVMTKDVVYAEVPSSTDEALRLIIEKNVSGLPVVKKDTKELVGVVTRTDFSKEPEEGQLALLMTKDVVTVPPSEDIKNAAKTFLVSGFRRLPVVEGKDLVGILTIEDIVWKAISKMDIKEAVSNYMVKFFTAIWEDTPINVALSIMRLSMAKALPVLDSEAKLVGMVSDKDFLKVFQLKESTKKSELSGGTEGDRWGWDSKNIIYITKRSLEIPDMAVKEIMVKKIITATKNTSVSECAKKMNSGKIEQVPIIDAEGDLIGLARDTDLLRVLK